MMSILYSHLCWVIYTTISAEYLRLPSLLSILYNHLCWVFYTTISAEYFIQPSLLSILYNHLCWVFYTNVSAEYFQSSNYGRQWAVISLSPFSNYMDSGQSQTTWPSLGGMLVRCSSFWMIPSIWASISSGIKRLFLNF